MENHTNSSKYSFVILLLSLLFGFIWALTPGLLLVGLSAIIARLLIYRWTQNRLLADIFIVGYLVRMISSITLFLISIIMNQKILPWHPGQNILSLPKLSDAAYYQLRGLWLSDYLVRKPAIENDLTIMGELTNAYGNSLYVNVIGVIYSFIGYSPLLIELINCLIGSLLAIVCYQMANTIFDKKVALYSATLAIIYPSLFFLSIITLKDIPIIFTFTLSALLLLRCHQKNSVIYFLLLMISLFVLNLLKQGFQFQIFLAVVLLIYFIGLIG